MSQDSNRPELSQSAATLLGKTMHETIQHAKQVPTRQHPAAAAVTPDNSLAMSLLASETIWPHTSAPLFKTNSSSKADSKSTNSSSSSSRAVCDDDVSSHSSEGLGPITPPGSPGKLPAALHTCSSSSSSRASSSHDVELIDDDLSIVSQQALDDLVVADFAGTTDDLLVKKRYQAFHGKRILIISGGTRGDVQPATALGVALACLGAWVCIAADKSFQGFVEQHGLQYLALGGDAKQMMALTVSWGGMLPTAVSGMLWLRKQIKEVMESVWAAAEAFKPDVILANQLAYGQVHVAEKLRVPLHILLTIPWVPTRSIAHPWARAYGANITEYMNDVARALLTPAFAAVKWLNPKLGSRLEGRVLGWVEGASNYISTPLLDHMAWSGIADLMARFRHQLGLKQLSRNNLGSALYSYPTSCLFSSHLVPRPSDWQPHVKIIGFLSLSDAVSRFGSRQGATAHHEAADVQGNGDAAEVDQCEDESWPDMCTDPQTSAAGAWEPPQDLVDFLAAGPAPLYIGFGSMVVQDPTWLMQTVLKAAQELPSSQRFIICSGWSGMTSGSNEEAPAVGTVIQPSTGTFQHVADNSRMLFIEEAPHDWLFPRCCALLHHGGVGTTAVGLKHGRPTLVVSAFGDLFFWGEVCHKLGVGPAAISLEQLDSTTLACRLQDLVTNTRYQKSAAAVAQQLHSEDGLAGAVDSLVGTVTGSHC